MSRKSSDRKRSDQEKGWNRHKQLAKTRLETREKIKTYLIVCEGKTEEWYFRSFPVQTATVTSKGIGMTHLELIKKAKQWMNEKDYDEVWCVFDMDFNPERNGQLEAFNQAVFADKGQKLRCAYSNDAFELWFYLHYNYTDIAHLRTFYYEQLGQYWSMNYQSDGKAQEFSKTIYERLAQDSNASQQKAILRAKQLMDRYEPSSSPHKRNPVTTVFELVVQLNKHL
jgi:hypothetical protein